MHNCKPFTTSSQLGYTPIQIQTTYGINLISTPSNKPRGYGIKIAVITVYHYSNLQSDLNKYCTNYGLQPITLNIINQAESVANSNWALESCMNVQMLNTVVPGATVYVIESKSSSMTDIRTAITTAVNLGVNIVSLSFGTPEFSTQSSYESMFMNSGIAFIASSGDSNIVSYPATSANVLAIGGSTLTLNVNNTRLSEQTWTSSGSGTSIYTVKPSYQNLVNSNSKRNIPDLSLIGNPSYGFMIYSSINGGYMSVGGTSLGSPLMSGIIATADQLRKSSSKQMLNSISTSSLCVQTFLYGTIYNTLYSSCLYDITIGTDGNYSANTNYDIATGLGSINANQLCIELANL